MSKIQPVSLDDTLSLIQLARETALTQGRDAQANRLTPVVNDLRNLVNNTNKPSRPAPTAGILGQSDFKTLLEATQKKSIDSSKASSPVERNQMVNAMSAAEMPEVDIARQLGMTREEVHMILSVSQNSKSIGGK